MFSLHLAAVLCILRGKDQAAIVGHRTAALAARQALDMRRALGENVIRLATLREGRGDDEMMRWGEGEKRLKPTSSVTSLSPSSFVQSFSPSHYLQGLGAEEATQASLVVRLALGKQRL
jgi:hypothetical protein